MTDAFWRVSEYNLVGFAENLRDISDESSEARDNSFWI